MNKKIYTFFLLFLFGYSTVSAAPNVKTETTYDDNTDNNKCPTSIIVQDNLKGDKDLDFSDLDCMYYKMDNKGNFLLDENGEKILRDENDEIDFSCLQSFLDKYTNEEFKEAANDQTAEGFPTNKYCPVYCVEENEFLFPGYSPVINSGGHFTWVIGENDDKNILDGLTVRLHGTKVCRTNVDLNTWIDDYKKTMKEIEPLIKVTNPTGGQSNCITATLPGSTSGAKYIGGGLEKSKVTRYYDITSADFDVFSSYKTLSDLAANDRYANLANNIISGFIPNTSDAANIANGLISSNVAESNRYYITSAVVDVSERVDGIILLYNSGDGIAINYDMTKPQNYIHLNKALKTHAKNQKSTTIRIKVDIHELHSCGWIKTEGQSGGNKWSTNSSGMYLINNGIPTSGTVGYEATDTQRACGTNTGGSSLITDFVTTPSGQQCCDGYTTTSITTPSGGRCSQIGYDKDDCIAFGHVWIPTSQVIGHRYTCKRNPSLYTYYEEYHLKCGIGDTGDNQAIAATGDMQGCTNSNIPTCPTGYSYSPSTGKCYYADVSRIYTKLNTLLGLAKDLKQCQEQLSDYDYYLDTNMKIEYNETKDSLNNFYSPSTDNVTNTDLIKVSENVETIDNENLLGQYSSEIVKPSEKSDASASVNFFGKVYTFDKNGIPFVNCSLAGATKTCFAANNTSLSDYWYDWYGRTYIAIYEYRLDGNFYRWVKMPSGESISTKPTGDYLKYNRYIDIGYANYPVHFATPASKYEGLNIKITNIGFKNYLYNTYETQIENYNKNITDSSFVSTMQENELLHDCYYKVKEGEPYCPTTGCGDDEYDLGSVRIIYRPISLENPFPDMDASGRDTGSNWCKINDEKVDCSNLNDNVQKYILNNRNTSGSDIYFEREPMYEITLTPSLIKSIREYNATTDYDDYNLSCSGIDGEEGRKCRSNFVVDVADIDLPSLRDYITGCGIDSEWEACDNLDNYER